MHKAVRSIVSVVARRLRSRAEVELENLALRHQLHVLHRQRPGRPRLFAIDLALPLVATLSGNDGLGQARHCRSMAPSKLPPILTFAFEIGAAVGRWRDSESDSANEYRQPAVGSAPHPRRTA